MLILFASGIIIFSVIAVLLISMPIVILIIFNRRNKKMYKNIITLIEESYKNYENYELKINKNLDYDLTLYVKNFKFYIKIVKNFSNAEICVNNKTKWQLRQSAFDNSMRMVEGIDGLMNKKLDEEGKKNVRKLFIIYPNARALLQYINECEMIFIYHNTDVHGSTIITYTDLKEDGNILINK